MTEFQKNSAPSDRFRDTRKREREREREREGGRDSIVSRGCSNFRFLAEASNADRLAFSVLLVSPSRRDIFSFVLCLSFVEVRILLREREREKESKMNYNYFGTKTGYARRDESAQKYIFRFFFAQVFREKKRFSLSLSLSLYIQGGSPHIAI